MAAGLAGSQVPIAGTLHTLAPETAVEQQDASKEPAKKIIIKHTNEWLREMLHPI